MKLTRSATFLWLVTAGVLVFSAVLAVISVAMDQGRTVGMALSASVLAIGSCAVLALMLLRRREMLTGTIRWSQWWAHAAIAGAVGGLALFAAHVVLTERFGLRVRSGQTLLSFAAATVFTIGVLIIQIVLIRVLWPKRQSHAICAACKHPILASQQRCPECGATDIVGHGS